MSRMPEIWFIAPRALARRGEAPPVASGYTVVEGIATMRIDGPVSLEARPEGASWAAVRETIAAVKADATVSALVILINSGGGAVAGMQAAAYDLRELGKPSLAHIDPLGASAAFYFALAATYTWAAPTAFVGAVGVYVPVDTSPVEPAIVSRLTPEKHLPPDDPRAVESTAAAVDALARVMLTDLAEWAGLPDAAAAAAFYGSGNDFVAVDAFAAGMLDGVSVRPPLHLFNPAGLAPALPGGAPMPGHARAEAAAADEPDFEAEGDALAEGEEAEMDEPAEMSPEQKAARIAELEAELRKLKGEPEPEAEEAPGPAAVAFASRLVADKAINPAERGKWTQAYQRDPAKAMGSAPRAGAAYRSPAGEAVKPKATPAFKTQAEAVAAVQALAAAEFGGNYQRAREAYIRRNPSVAAFFGGRA